MSYCVHHYPFTFSNLTIPNKVDQNRVISRMNISKELQQLKLVSNVLLFHLTKFLILIYICAVPINIHVLLMNYELIINLMKPTYTLKWRLYLKYVSIFSGVLKQHLCNFVIHVSSGYLLTTHIFGKSLHFYKWQFILFC
jgi:hypothetical protein